jgi:hypothetical protein
MCMKNEIEKQSAPHGGNFLQNVKEHATLSARAGVDHRIEIRCRKEHVNRAADRGCCVSSCSAFFLFIGGVAPHPYV